MMLNKNTLRYKNIKKSQIIKTPSPYAREILLIL